MLFLSATSSHRRIATGSAQVFSPHPIPLPPPLSLLTPAVVPPLSLELLLPLELFTLPLSQAAIPPELLGILKGAEPVPREPGRVLPDVG
jgi:hypothetical protein